MPLLSIYVDDITMRRLEAAERPSTMSRELDGCVNLCHRCRRNTELTYSSDLDEYLCDECLSFTRCEKCSGFMKPPGTFNEFTEEFWCDSCVENANEAAYERQQAAHLESPPETMREQYLRAWHEHQEAHKR